MPGDLLRNPILRGFNPDPAICRVGERYFVATSTFEWYPGIQIWESDDLRLWRLRSRPLNDARLLDLNGVQSSGGVWAPCLTHREGAFFLAYTVVRSWRGETDRDHGAFKDTLNYVVRAESIDGPWSDPVFANASGFDPSLFHDDDGRSWFLNMEWDYRGDPTHFSGILIQEFDRESLRPFGPARKIFWGTPLDRVEGPHLYKRDGWYYLLTAEGGTSYEHAVTVARSRTLMGPYEVHPGNPVLSSLADRRRDKAVIDHMRESRSEGGRGGSGRDVAAPEGFYSRPQKAGHASMCPLDDDQWVMVHLSARPLEGSAFCPLGRETSIQRVRWIEGWPTVVGNTGEVSRFPLPEVALKLPEAAPAPSKGVTYTNHDTSVVDTFDGASLHPAFRFLRRDPGGDISLAERPGYLRLRGYESPVSTFRQTVVAMAVTAFAYSVEVELEFAPDSFQQMAGLLVRYDERNQYYLRVAGGGEGAGTVGIVRFVDGRLDLPLTPEIDLRGGPVILGIEVDGAEGRFYLSAGRRRRFLPVPLDMLNLSDESPWPEGFTGTFAGMACHDMTGRGMHADFSRFSYREP